MRRAGVELLHVLPQREPQALRHVLEVCRRLGRCTAQEASITLMPWLRCNAEVHQFAAAIQGMLALVISMNNVSH